MKTTQRLSTVWTAALGLVLAGGAALAADDANTKTEPSAEAVVFAPGPAVARQNNINVRGRAAINSEIVTHLQKGETVLALEEVILKKPHANEPAKWYRIVLPTNAPAWVHADYINPTNKTVRPKRLNVRGGPGENYSVLARLDQGAEVKVVEEKGRWLKIEVPTNACGFVAAHLMLKQAAPMAVVAQATPPPAITNVAEIKTNEVAVATPPTTAAATNVVAAETNTPATTNTGMVLVTATPPDAAATPPELVKRVVTREGMLKGTFSIQAPTYLELRSLDNNRVINYVWSPTTNIVLKPYKGKKVIVTGEELLDERWPNTPVINVDEINVVP